jgi:hypothetical protein
MKPIERDATLDTPQKGPPLDVDALLCALVLAPRTYPRNRFFKMFELPELSRVRRRAARVRSVVRQLAGSGENKGHIIGEQIFDDRVLLRYKVDSVHFARTTSLAPLEAALVHYALHTATGTALPARDRELVETALARLGDNLSPLGLVAKSAKSDALGEGDPE